MKRIIPTREFLRDLAVHNEEVETAVRAYADDQANTGACVCCGFTDLIQSRGLIPRCYRREARAGNLDRFPRRTP